MKTAAWGSVSVATEFELNVVMGPNSNYSISTDRYGNVNYNHQFFEAATTDEEFESHIKLRKSGAHVQYRADFGLHFSQNGFRGDLRVPFAFSGNLEGLCANFDQNKLDDFRCNDGTVFDFEGNGYARTSSEWETAKCWKLDGTDGPDPRVIDDELENCEHRTEMHQVCLFRFKQN